MKILTDLHTHTVASTHAFSTVTENATAAREKGLELIAMTDHVSLCDSPHDWLFYSMGNLPKEISGIRVIKGIETNIMNEQGEVYIPFHFGRPPLIELVLAAWHDGCRNSAFCPTSEDSFVRTMQNLASNKEVHIVAHMCRTPHFSRLDEIIPSMVYANKAIEINGFSFNAYAQENCRHLIHKCKEHGAKIAVNSDAHFYYHIGEFDPMIEYLIEIGYDENLIVNRNKAAVLEFLGLED